MRFTGEFAVYRVVALTLAAASAALFAGATFAGKPAVNHPTPALADCAASDIIGAQVLNCTGFFDKNLLNEANATQDKTILAALGYSGWDGQFANSAIKIDNLNGSKTLDFGVKLTGISYIAVHYGAGRGSPGNGTAFYVLDAAQGVSQLRLAYDASSSAILFSTEAPDVTGVPEPASWATMIAGFGLIGAQMRRRRRSAAAA